MARPLGTTGSLGPTCVSARGVPLTVRQAYTLMLSGRNLSLPLHTSGTLWEVTAPVKLPLNHCPRK